MNKNKYRNDDITFCGSECNHKDCHRHPSNIHTHWKQHSFSDFKDTIYCEKSVEKNK